MAGQRQQEMQKSKPDIEQGNASLPQTFVSLEMWWLAQLQACKYKRCALLKRGLVAAESTHKDITEVAVAVIGGPRWLWKEFSGFTQQDVLVVSQDSFYSFILWIVNKNQGIRGAVNVQDVSPVFN